MKRLDVSDFLQEVLAKLDDLPDGLEERLLAQVTRPATRRWEGIRDSFAEARRA